MRIESSNSHKEVPNSMVSILDSDKRLDGATDNLHSQSSIQATVAQFLKTYAKEKITLTKEKETLLITLYAKAGESHLPDSILHDHFAAELIERINYDFSKLKVDLNLMIAMAVRAHILDGWTHKFISHHPDSIVLNLGCGLDSRVFRIDPPQRVLWFDVDYPEVIELRHHLYPDREGYHLIGTSVTHPSWIEQLPADRPVMMIAEGLLMYLEKEEMLTLLKRVTDHFPTGVVAFDVFSNLGEQVFKNYPSIRATHAILHGNVENSHDLEHQIPKLTLLTERSAYELKDDFAKQFAQMSLLVRLLFRMFATVPSFRRMNEILSYRF